MIENTVSMAARPGVRSGSLASSFIVRVTSQPQNMKTEAESPITTTDRPPSIAKGLNHASSGMCGSKAPPWTLWTIAITANTTRITTWNATRPYCSFCEVVTSRKDTQAASATKTRHTATFTNGLRVISAMASLPEICEISRNRKSTAMPARLDNTRIVATISPHPAIQPTYGPKALVAQVKLVPESGMALLSSR